MSRAPTSAARRDGDQRATGELVPKPQVLNRYAYARDTPLRYTGGRARRGLLPSPRRWRRNSTGRKGLGAGEGQ